MVARDVHTFGTKGKRCGCKDIKQRLNRHQLLNSGGRTLEFYVGFHPAIMEAEKVDLSEYEKIDSSELRNGDQVLFKGKNYYFKPNGTVAHLYRSKDDFERKVNCYCVARKKLQCRKKSPTNCYPAFEEESESSFIPTPFTTKNKFQKICLIFPEITAE
jgi:hypothetical protein